MKAMDLFISILRISGKIMYDKIWLKIKEIKKIKKLKDKLKNKLKTIKQKQPKNLNIQHTYAKLDPTKILNQKGAAVDNEEGALSKGNEGDKKNQGDFVLWKKSKEKEPFWNSPWGNGRPGWHIECSSMCSEIFGENLDIHTGGCDLKFPHHDNEIAQTEAFYDHDQWINYFLHTGHLNIEGLKMSKSLKNFKKISDFIDKYSANTFRLFFCTNRWDNDMDFT